MQPPFDGAGRASHGGCHLRLIEIEEVALNDRGALGRR
jgi:hypothetical protein